MSKESRKDEIRRFVARRPRAAYDYEILEKYEAGLVLLGSEVKSLRDGHVSIEEAYGRIRNGEVFLLNMEVPPYANAPLGGHAPKRVRKLLLHRREILKLQSKTKERGLTIVPLALYFKDGIAKIEIGLGKGRKKWDKRDHLRKEEVKRDLRQQAGRRR